MYSTQADRRACSCCGHSPHKRHDQACTQPQAGATSVSWTGQHDDPPVMPTCGTDWSPCLLHRTPPTCSIQRQSPGAY
ncbi:hypothetical protein ElyMa_000518500 [Elysia marginata]|uniref:Uncharacterized protein n=1 Tax=Elysia marginata TaxID=1093978 RepID=A0AAV4FY77_9GAST|nr:hypothetical protein ElyMa_000518500 [Elysia marginata]